MCLPRSTPRLTALTAPPPLDGAADPAAAPAATGSRRRRLWDLPAAAHCPVVGVCLPIQALRRLVDRLNGPRPLADDYALHCSVVADCRQRSPVAEALQRELERRYALALRQAAQAKTTEALAAWWDAALQGHDQAAGQSLAGAFWATLTHARCTPALQDCVLGHMHMLQHQAGMATRVDLDRLDALIDENAVLGRALGAAQRRHQQLAAEHQQRQAALQAETLQLRAQLMARELELAQLRDALATVSAGVTHNALAADNAAQADRIQQLERQCLQARHEAERAQRMVARLAGQLQAARSGTAAVEAEADTASPATVSDGPAPATAPVQLDNQAVLCVGGRASAVPLYRLIVERSGGRFIHHDGGERDSSARLDATLAAADLVICQTGCVSHNAYWRVKDHCKRTGKRCVFVETPSSAGLKRALVQLAPACSSGPTTDVPPALPDGHAG